MEEEVESSAPHISLPEFLFIGITLVIVDLINWVPVLGSIVGAAVGPGLTIYTFLRRLPSVSPIIAIIASITEEIPALQVLPIYTISFVIIYIMTNHPTFFAVAATGGAAAPIAIAEKFGVPGAGKVMGAIRAGSQMAVQSTGGPQNTVGAALGAESKAAVTTGAEAIERRPSRRTSMARPTGDGSAEQSQNGRGEYAKEFYETHDVMKRSADQLFRPLEPGQRDASRGRVRPDGTIDLSGSALPEEEAV